MRRNYWNAGRRRHPVILPPAQSLFKAEICPLAVRRPDFVSSNIEWKTRQEEPGPDVPAGTLALVRSSLALRSSKEQNALHTLIHQRHLTPSFGGHVPTAKRTLDPARMFTESLTPGPELENSLGHELPIQAAENKVRFHPKRPFPKAEKAAGSRQQPSFCVA